MGYSIVESKAEDFAVKIIELSKALKQTKHEYELASQILRSGTSIGANINEAINGISKKDFLSKMYIALKECAETHYWLRLLFRTQLISHEEFDDLSSNCTELKKILISITKTTSQSLKK